MKNIVKFLIIALGAGIGALTMVRADDSTTAPTTPNSDQPGQFRHHDRGGGERMMKALGLTADQQTKWQALHQQEEDALKAMRADTTLTKEQKQAKARDIRKSFEDQRNALLTPDQQKKAAEIREKMKEHHAQHNNGTPPTPPTPAPAPAP